MLTSSHFRQKQNSVKIYQRNPLGQWATEVNKSDAEDFDDNSCSENFYQYLINSSLHGLRYVGEKSISIFERGFFLIAFIVVTCCSIYFISNVYAKWSATPVIITLSATATPITDIPFPAVTICNMNKARESVVKNFKDNSIESIFLQNVCQKENYNITHSNQTSDAGRWDIFKQFLLNISQPCNEMLRKCRYALEPYKCIDLFDTVLSDEGLCCTFNSVHPMFLYKKYNLTEEFNDELSTEFEVPVDWTPEEGFAAVAPDETRKIYPRRGISSGIHMGLFIVLNADIDDYYCSSTNSAGFKILLHSPTETPKVADYGFFVNPGFETGIVITPRITSSSKLIRKVPQIKRQCIFGNEANLTYFRTYSKRNCLMECQARIIEKECGCVIYYLPRINANSKICSRKDAWCYDRIRLAIERTENDTYECQCLPACFDLSFIGDISVTRLGTDGFSIRESDLHNLTPDLLRRNIAVVHIFYSDSSFRSNHKEELIGFTDFLSNTGGLLGLFMGFSVLSIVEILYFTSLRPYCAYKKRRKLDAKLLKSKKFVHVQRAWVEKQDGRNGSDIVRNKNIAKELFNYARSFSKQKKALKRNEINYPYFE